MMALKPKAIDETSAKSIIKGLPMIEGNPDYEGINKIMQILYANTSNFPTPQGGGHHRENDIIMKLMLYTTPMTTD